MFILDGFGNQIRTQHEKHYKICYLIIPKPSTRNESLHC